jgi:MFS family permease
VTVTAVAPASREHQRGAYSLLLILSGVALGVSGVPAPLYGMYQDVWHLSPLSTTIVFAVYAVAALAAVLVAGRVSDVIGRKPVLLGALLAMIVGLGVFLIADNMATLMIARIIHGAAVGSIVVAGAAALLDLRPDHGARAGQLSGVSFNIGMTVAIVGSSVLAQYAPHPMRTPYAVVAALCAVVGVGVVALREPHAARSRGPIRITKPAVPREIRADFWFAALGVMASWSVLGVLLSLYPSLAARQTEVHNLVFGGAVVGSTAFAAALVQMVAARVPARVAAIAGDVGMAIALLLTVPALATHQWPLVLAAAALLGATFGLGFGGSLRHLSNVVPADRRGETMSAYYLLAYSAMAVPTIAAGWAATRWPLATVFPVFAGAVALACLAAAAVGAATSRRTRVTSTPIGLER